MYHFINTLISQYIIPFSQKFIQDLNILAFKKDNKIVKSCINDDKKETNKYYRWYYKILEKIGTLFNVQLSLMLFIICDFEKKNCENDVFGE